MPGLKEHQPGHFLTRGARKRRFMVNRAVGKEIGAAFIHMVNRAGEKEIGFLQTKEKSALLRLKKLNPATTYSPGPLPAKYHQRAEA